jgi:hypothetical protein
MGGHMSPPFSWCGVLSLIAPIDQLHIDIRQADYLTAEGISLISVCPLEEKGELARIVAKAAIRLEPKRAVGDERASKQDLVLC